MSTLAHAYSFHGITKAYLEGLFRTISEAAWENIILVIMALVANSRRFEILLSPFVFWVLIALIPILYAVQLGRVYGPYWGGHTKHKAIAVLLGRSTTVVVFALGMVWLVANLLNNPGWRGFVNRHLYDSALLIWNGLAWYVLVLGLSLIIPFGVASLKFKALVAQHIQQQQELQQQQQQQG